MPNNCQGCIISDMRAACKPDDKMCHLFHRRLAGLLTGKPEVLKAGTCETCLYAPKDSAGCIRHAKVMYPDNCWVEENVK